MSNEFNADQKYLEQLQKEYEMVKEGDDLEAYWNSVREVQILREELQEIEKEIYEIEKKNLYHPTTSPIYSPEKMEKLLQALKFLKEENESYGELMDGKGEKKKELEKTNERVKNARKVLMENREKCLKVEEELQGFYQKLSSLHRLLEVFLLFFPRNMEVFERRRKNLKWGLGVTGSRKKTGTKRALENVWAE